MRSFFSRHFCRHRFRILFSNSIELLRTRRYSASILARSASIRRSITRQSNVPRERERAGAAPRLNPRTAPRPQLADPSPEPSIWMRLGSRTAAAPATLTSSTPSRKRALMLLSSVPSGKDMLLRNDP
jgi:hypothetical protein